MPENMMLYIWLTLAIVFAITEVVTVGLTTIWFSLGALVSLLLVICGVDNITVQIVVFVLVSLLSLIATRPLVKKYINKKVQPTNADRCIGKEAFVTEEINNVLSKGAVKVNGVEWSARSEDNSVIEIGKKVKIISIDGVKVIVQTTI
ncbi:MAG: NfeD family protein [Clostridia bacterium]|nr:NfeD family protein [Clostridia bacterium]